MVGKYVKSACAANMKFSQRKVSGKIDCRCMMRGVNNTEGAVKALVSKTSRILVGFLLTVSPFVRGSGQEYLGDRLLFELDGTPYTQRQVEVYALWRAVVGSSPGNLRLSERSLWELAINDYITSLLIRNFVGRDGATAASDQSWDNEVARYRVSLRESPLFAPTLRRLAPTDDEIEEATGLFRIVLRETQKRTPSAAAVSAQEAAQRFRTWFNDLRNRASLRILSGSLEYREIRFATR